MSAGIMIFRTIGLCLFKTADKCVTGEKIVTWENWYTFFNIKKKSRKKIFPYLPYLAFPDMLPEPHLYFFLALLSSLNHLLKSLPNPDDKIMKEINEIFYSFIWEGTSRIKKKVICQDYCNGGLKMINTEAFITALKTTWLRKLIISNNIWSEILQSTVNTQSLLKFGTAYIVEKVLPKTKNMFWIDVFRSHIQFYYIQSHEIQENIDEMKCIFYIYTSENIKLHFWITSDFSIDL